MQLVRLSFARVVNYGALQPCVSSVTIEIRGGEQGRNSVVKNESLSEAELCDISIISIDFILFFQSIYFFYL